MSNSTAAKKRWESGVYADAFKNRGPLSAEHRAKISATLSGRRPHAFSRESIEKMRAAKLGKPGPWLGKKRGPLRPEWAANIGKSNRGRTCAYARRVSYNGVSFRSPWEVRLAQSLDRLGVRWEYEPQRFVIDESASFLPDFYLPDDDAFWEVKGWYDGFSRRRVEGFRRLYPQFPLVLVTEHALELIERASFHRGA